MNRYIAGVCDNKLPVYVPGPVRLQSKGCQVDAPSIHLLCLGTKGSHAPSIHLFRAETLTVAVEVKLIFIVPRVSRSGGVSRAEGQIAGHDTRVSVCLSHSHTRVSRAEGQIAGHDTRVSVSLSHSHTRVSRAEGQIALTWA